MKRGIALLWAMVLCSILLIVTGSMVSYITKESRFSVQIEDSGRAYGASKSGIEWAVQMLKNNPNFTSTGTTINLAGSQVTVRVTAGNPVLIESTGISGTTTRKIDFEYSPYSFGTNYDSTRSNINTTTPTSTTVGSNTESFTLTFDFWGGYNGTGFGLRSSDNTKRIGAHFSPAWGTSMKIWTDNVASPAYDNNLADNTRVTNDTHKGETYHYKATITYLKDTAAMIKIYAENDRINQPGVYTCVASGTRDLSGISLGDLSYFYAYTPGVNETGTTYSTDNVSYITNGTDGDGTWLRLNDGGATNLYIDNIFLKK